MISIISDAAKNLQTGLCLLRQHQPARRNRLHHRRRRYQRPPHRPTTSRPGSNGQSETPVRIYVSHIILVPAVRARSPPTAALFAMLAKRSTWLTHAHFCCPQEPGARPATGGRAIIRSSSSCRRHAPQRVAQNPPTVESVQSLYVYIVLFTY